MSKHAIWTGFTFYIYYVQFRQPLLSTYSYVKFRQLFLSAFMSNIDSFCFLRVCPIQTFYIYQIQTAFGFYMYIQFRQPLLSICMHKIVMPLQKQRRFFVDNLKFGVQLADVPLLLCVTCGALHTHITHTKLNNSYVTEHEMYMNV